MEATCTIKGIFWVSIQGCCYCAFIIQIVMLISEQINPTQTLTHLEETKMEDIDFPVVFKICFKNSFYLDQLKAAGYNSVWQYFQGVSRFNRSVFGWAGHTENGSIGEGVKGEHQLRLPSTAMRDANICVIHKQYLIRF